MKSSYQIALASPDPSSLNISKKLSHIRGLSATNLKLFKMFYRAYPQISQTVTDQFKLEFQKSQSLTDQFISTPTEKLLRSCTFTHFVEFIKIDEDLKRIFYEVETIKGNWSVRELKRQVNSQTYERIGLSKDKKEMIDSINNISEVFLPEQIIKDPYILEFTGVEYATAGLDNALFISNYKINLPSIDEITLFIEDELELLERGKQS